MILGLLILLVKSCQLYTDKNTFAFTEVIKEYVINNKR